MNGSLLDTNILSELIRSRPEPQVQAWVSSQSEATLFMSVITIGELCRGFYLLPAGKRRLTLEAWFHDDVVPRFHSRILPVTQAIAERWGIIDADARGQGIAVPTTDGLITATALEHGLTIVTRNVNHFRSLGVSVLNPWPSG